MKEFSVYDSKAEVYIYPFVSPTTASGSRAFENSLNNPENQFSLFPADYTLFETGSWDELSGLHTNHAAHINLGTALSYKSKEKT